MTTVLVYDRGFYDYFTVNYIFQNKNKWAKLLKEGVSNVVRSGAGLIRAKIAKGYAAAIIATKPAALAAVDNITQRVRAWHVAQNQEIAGTETLADDNLLDNEEARNEVEKAESLEERIYNELNKFQEEVIEEYYYKAKKCGEEQFEKSWKN